MKKYILNRIIYLETRKLMEMFSIILPHYSAVEIRTSDNPRHNSKFKDHHQSIIRFQYIKKKLRHKSI